MGAMRKFRQSIYQSEHQLLIQWLIKKRVDLDLTQRQLAERLNVVHSLVGKVEKGERRLDIVEFVAYCRALEVQKSDITLLFEKIENEAS